MAIYARGELVKTHARKEKGRQTTATTRRTTMRIQAPVLPCRPPVLRQHTWLRGGPPKRHERFCLQTGPASFMRRPRHRVGSARTSSRIQSIPRRLNPQSPAPLAPLTLGLESEEGPAVLGWFSLETPALGASPKNLGDTSPMELVGPTRTAVKLSQHVASPEPSPRPTRKLENCRARAGR